MIFSLEDIYQIGKYAVQLFPANPDYPCLQAQTFRVLQFERGSEVGTPNLGAVSTDKDTPFFWSRKWHNAKHNPNALSFEYPVVTMFEVIGETTKPAFAKGFQDCYTIEIAVLDVYREDCTDGSKRGCTARPVNQIFIDTRIILNSILQYFGNIVTATTSADPVEKAYYKPYLDYLLGNGDITAFNVITTLQNSLNAANPRMRFTRVERPAQKIYGTKTQFIFCTSNCPFVEYDNTMTDFGTLAFEAGCRDCR